MSKFSVRKPFTVMVGVIMAIVLGYISFTNLTPDLLPSIELPYAVVTTPYIGAGPEKVEAEVTKPLEESFATLSGLNSISSTSSEDMSMVILEFSESVNMDSAIIELSGLIDTVSSGFESETIGGSIIMRLNPDMMPVMTLSVNNEGQSEEEITEFVEEVVVPAIERVPGVASVDETGAITSRIEITPSQEKVDEISNALAAEIESGLNEGIAQMDEAEAELNSALAELDAAHAQFSQQLGDGLEQLLGAEHQMTSGYNQIVAAIAGISMQIATAQEELDALDPTDPANAAQIAILEGTINGLTGQLTALNTQRTALEVQISDFQATLPGAQADILVGQSEFDLEMARAYAQIDAALAQLSQARTDLENERDEILAQADMSGVITIDAIAGIISAQNFELPAGFIDSGEESTYLKVGDEIDSLNELLNLPIFFFDINGGTTYTISDLCDIEITTNEDESYARLNGENAIILSVQKQSGSSTAGVAADVRATMDELMAENDGLYLTALMDQGIYINIIIDSVLGNLIYGGLLALIILVLFLRDLRPTFVIAISIPISLMIAISLMYFSGITLNIVSLGGLALGVGMLVDNSIVVIENIYRLRSEGVRGYKAAIEGAREVGGAIFASTLTTVSVFLPIVFTEGITKQIFTDMGLTIAYSLLSSLLVALTVVPSLASTMLANKKEKKHGIFTAITNGYAAMLRFAIKARWGVIVLSLVLLVSSVSLALSNGTSFMPAMGSNQISATAIKPDGISDAQFFEKSAELEEEFATIEGVLDVGASFGGNALMGGFGGGSSDISYYMIVDEEYSSEGEAISAQMTEMATTAGIELSVSTTNMDMSMLSGSGIAINIYGTHLEDLEESAEILGDMLRGIEGIDEVTTGLEDFTEQLHVDVDREAAVKAGFTVAEVYMAVSEALVSEEASSTLLFEDGDYPVALMKPQSELINEDNILELELTNREDEIVVLGEIATANRINAPQSINRSDLSRTMSVNATLLEGYNIGIVGGEVSEAVENIDLVGDVTYEMSGESETIASSMDDLILMIAMAILFIYLIMVAQFQSLLSPFIVMFTIPLAFTGGFLALYIGGFEVSIISMFGFLMLAGVIVNNGIVYIDYVNQLRLRGYKRHDALIKAGKDRLRPIVMTAATTVLAMTTMAFSGEMGAEMTAPMAIVTIGGLIYGTLLTLFLVPSVYEILCKKDPKKREDKPDDDEQKSLDEKTKISADAPMLLAEEAEPNV